MGHSVSSCCPVRCSADWALLFAALEAKVPAGVNDSGEETNFSPGLGNDWVALEAAPVGWKRNL